MPRKRSSRNNDGILNQFYSAESISPGDTVLILPDRQLPQLPLEADHSISRRCLPIFEYGSQQFINRSEIDVADRVNARSLSVNSTVVNETRCCDDSHTSKCCKPRQFSRNSKGHAKKKQPYLRLSGRLIRINSLFSQRSQHVEIISNVAQLYKVFKHQILESYVTIIFYINGEKISTSFIQEDHLYTFRGYTTCKRAGYYFSIINRERVLVYDVLVKQAYTYESNSVSIIPGFTGYNDNLYQNNSHADKYASAILPPSLGQDYISGIYNTDDYNSIYTDVQVDEFRHSLDEAIKRTMPAYGHNVRVGENGNYVIENGLGNPSQSVSGVETINEDSNPNLISERWIDLNTTMFQGKQYIVLESEYDGYVDLYSSSDGAKSISIPSDDVGKISIRSFDSTIPWVSGMIR